MQDLGPETGRTAGRYLALSVERFDGSVYTERTERRSARARREMDREAFDILSRYGVKSVRVTPTDVASAYTAKG